MTLQLKRVESTFAPFLQTSVKYKIVEEEAQGVGITCRIPFNRLNHDSLELLREIAGDDEFPYKSDLIMNADGTKRA